MNNQMVRNLSAALLAGALAMASGSALADHFNWVKTSDGLTFRLGVTPASYVLEHPEVMPAGHPVVAGNGSFHLLVAVFDSTTGVRVEDADVEVRVGQLGLSTTSKQLVPWRVNGMLTYCNFFPMSAGNVNVIDVIVRQTAGAQPVRTQFTHTPFAG